MTTRHYHAVIWIDHHEARVFHFSPTDVEKLVLHPDHPTRHIHHKANSIGSGHAAEDHNFLQAIVGSVADAGAVLITGPASRPSIIQATGNSLPMPGTTSRPRIGCCRRRIKRWPTDRL
jgi:hypothetical protein